MAVDPHVNPATGVWDDNYYAQTYGGGGGGGGGSFAPRPYSEVNPFKFDEELARAAATQEYSPYYNETLSDYVATTERTKSRSAEDLSRTLSLLQANKDYFVGTERRLLDKSIKNTNEGYAGRGLFFSGARPKDVQELQDVSGEKVNDYMTGYNYNVKSQQLGSERTIADTNTAAAQYKRDLEREKKYAIESGVLTRKGEAQQEYAMGQQNYYDKYYNA